MNEPVLSDVLFNRAVSDKHVWELVSSYSGQAIFKNKIFDCEIIKYWLNDATQLIVKGISIHTTLKQQLLLEEFANDLEELFEEKEKLSRQEIVIRELSK